MTPAEIARSLTEADDCENHTFQPEGYIGWHGWAEEMSKTHVQRKCRGCGLYMIWEPKPRRPRSPRKDER